MSAPWTIALVAHDRKKDELVAFVRRYHDVFARCRLYATGTTGARLLEACPDLAVTRLKSGPLGGDQQLGALIAEERIDLLVFFIDPLTPMPHDVDVKALTRLAVLYDVPLACSARTAELLLEGALRGDSLRRAAPSGVPERQPS